MTTQQPRPLLERIASTARLMLTAQRAYVREQTPETLATAKRLERELDKLLTQHRLGIEQTMWKPEEEI